jgi:diadenosine tetraphosphate (Ap4A) HIT family hydrolase
VDILEISYSGYSSLFKKLVFLFGFLNPNFSYYRVHIVAIPKKHIPSLTTMEEGGQSAFNDLMDTVGTVAGKAEKEYGACRVITNAGVSGFEASS